MTRTRGGHPTRAALVLAAVGVVFGDIGTSPLYAMKTLFTLGDGALDPTPEVIYGVISLVFWSITLVVSVKYLGIVTGADNEGEGGVMALAHLAHAHVRHHERRRRLVLMLGVFGGALFFGDSLITPAISVLSAVEGLQVATPALDHLVVPIAVAVITGLFAVQRFGTARVGRVLGPVMVLWFLTLGVLGLVHVVQEPRVLTALSPTYAIGFATAHPGLALLSLGAVVLTITGAEALYADMGHFGRLPIALAWFLLAFPCLTLNYLGQAQLLLADGHEAADPFFHLAPPWARIPLVVLATLATIIASQAVISGAFSVARQAERLGFLPWLRVRHTGTSSGQIYLPLVNWLLLAGVLVLLVTFRSSERLATAYGIAVTLDLLLTTTLFTLLAVTGLRWPWWRAALFLTVFGLIELAFFAANIVKVLHGGWLPLLVAFSLGTVMSTWHRGRVLLADRRRRLEGPLEPFLDTVRADGKILRVPGTAVFLHHDLETVPLALRENVQVNRVLHDEVVIVTAEDRNVPHVAEEDRVAVEDLDPYDHIVLVRLRFGFSDDKDLPAALATADQAGVDVDRCTYFLSRITVHDGGRPGMGRLRKRLFLLLTRNAADPADYFRLPLERTVHLGAQVNI